MRLALGLVALIVLAACATAGAPAGGRPLEGPEWRLVELPGRSAVPAGADDAAPYLRFEADSGRVVGNTGCNLLGGPYARDGESLTFGPLITTKRACVEAARNAAEADFLGALQATRRWAIADDTLTLASDAGPVARLVAR